MLWLQLLILCIPFCQSVTIIVKTFAENYRTKIEETETLVDLEQSTYPDLNIVHLEFTSLYNKFGEYTKIGNIKNFPSLSTIKMSEINLEELPIFSQLPAELQELYLNNNNIQEISNYSLSHITCVNISLSHNKIGKIATQAFGRFGIISLDYNNLTEFNANWFIYPDSVQYLTVTHNKIRSLQEHTLNLFTELNHFDLSNNQLKIIENGALFGSPTNSTRFMLFNNNKLSEIPISVLNDTYESVVQIVNNNLTVLKKQESEQLMSNNTVVMLMISHNNIKEIEPKYFGKILQINLGCNKLTQFSTNWFTHPEMLVWLSLAGNQIHILSQNALNLLPNLHYFDLSSNQLKAIEDTALSGPNAFQYLFLNNNNLTELLPSVFDNENNINYFDIGYNKLTFLRKSFIDTFTNLQYVNMFGNSWQCPCFNKFKNWFEDKGAYVLYHPSIVNEAKCIVANSYAKYCVELYESELYETYIRNIPEFDGDICPTNRLMDLGEFIIQEYGYTKI